MINGDFYQYHTGDDEKLRLFIVVFIIGYLLPWYLLLGEEVAHNLLGGRDPSLVDGLGSTALPTSVLLLGEEMAHNLLGGRDLSWVNGLAQYGPPNNNTVFGILATTTA